MIAREGSIGFARVFAHDGQRMSDPLCDAWRMTKLILRIEIEELIEGCAENARRLRREAERKRNRHWKHHLPLLIHRAQSFRSYCVAELSHLDDWRADEAEPADIPRLFTASTHGC